ncbi:Mur ligase family protein [Saprospira sp. CCB-QB6]|uniref:bifunctional folylpolyglutamate synthase/dihydrofolate synthase n=1 Tax=Saprospira sp. CCB-QB6 TaxID=3023936 RepID=UPI00234A7394|nr:Mur ligase family protein [Saprospira sp. CCB-QB6]WCL81235.1 Mur ligase family protein [Saprospira sp. CCB-QB6]
MKKNNRPYQEALDFLYAQLPMFQRQGSSAFKKTLDNSWRLSERLGAPEKKFRSVHIAGTNGKGSTTHILAGLLQAQGYKVGVYSSPHYKDFRERIKINGQYISEEEVINFVAEQKEFILGQQLSFFELTVGMAFHYFAQQKVDWAIIETGLGGRLDSTNIISPELSLITNIGWDHSDILGESLGLIAGEKAGIIKAQTPVIIGERQSEEIAQAFAQKAKAEQAPLYYAEELVQLEKGEENLLGGQYGYQYKSADSADIFLDLAGDFQFFNLRLALAALHLMQEKQLIDISEEKIKFALANIRSLTGFMGRWQLLEEGPPMLLCDSAHNVDGLRYLGQMLAKMEYAQLHFVFGMVRDKSAEKILSSLPKEANYYFAAAQIPRAKAADQLAQEAASFGLMGQAYESVAQALAAAKAVAQKDDIIFVGGSIFVVAEIL